MDKKEYMRQYYQKHKVELSAKAKVYNIEYLQRPETKLHRKQYLDQYYQNPVNRQRRKGSYEKYRNKPKTKEKLKELEYNRKIICIKQYSNGSMKCECCGESIIEFLTIDHINGGGTKHRKEIRVKIYGWLIRNNFPKGFRVLCMNCNWGIRYTDVCPHKSK